MAVSLLPWQQHLKHLARTGSLCAPVSKTAKAAAIDEVGLPLSVQLDWFGSPCAPVVKNAGAAAIGEVGLLLSVGASCQPISPSMLISECF